MTDPLRNTTSYVLDGAGNVTQITDAKNGLTRLSYDDIGNLLTVTDANGHAVLGATGNQYDLRNRLTKSCDAMGNRTTYSGYDADDNLTQVKSGTGIETDYKYDNFNRRKEIDYDVGGSSPSSIQLTYDLGDRLIQAVDSLAGF